jgi:acetolactate synthase I/II/III large subunit
LHLIAVPIDYSENTRVLVDELRHMQDYPDSPSGS